MRSNILKVFAAMLLAFAVPMWTPGPANHGHFRRNRDGSVRRGLARRRSH